MTVNQLIAILARSQVLGLPAHIEVSEDGWLIIDGIFSVTEIEK